jgi:hypothetical protein
VCVCERERERERETWIHVRKTVVVGCVESANPPVPKPPSGNNTKP